MRSGMPGTWCSGAPYVSVDPMFTNASDSSGASADYHLRGTSPVSDSATTLGGVPDDYDGAARPIGGGYAIGAFEQ
jgi:hypothetical protein